MTNLEKYVDDIAYFLACDDCVCFGDVTQDGCASCKAKASCSQDKEVIKKWLLAEYKEPILDYVEKQYLENVLKPFKNRTQYIAKWSNENRNEIFTEHHTEHLSITCDSLVSSELCDIAILPDFLENTMYKGMELGKYYTLEELGLFEVEEND